MNLDNKENNAYAATIQSGTCGSCSWEIDDTGLLRIFPTDGISGVLANNTDDNLFTWGWQEDYEAKQAKK
jgi:hypothetical protein